MKQFNLYDESSELTKQIRTINKVGLVANDFFKDLASSVEEKELEKYRKAYMDFESYANNKMLSLPNDKAVSFKYHFKKDGYAEHLFKLLCLYAVNKGFDVVEADNKTVTITDTFTHAAEETIMVKEFINAGVPVTII